MRGGSGCPKDSVVACVRVMSGGKAKRERRTFDMTTAAFEALRDWLISSQCTLVAMGHRPRPLHGFFAKAPSSDGSR